MKIPRLPVSLAALVALPAFLSTSHAALLLYEGFDGYTAGTKANALTPNGNTYGVSGSYANDGMTTDGNPANTPTMLSASGTGISFGQLQTSGGSLAVGNGTGVAQTRITTTTGSGQIWGSYLVNLTANNSSTASFGFEVRLNSDANSSSTNAYFRANADTRGTTSANPAVSYDNSLGSPASAGLALGTDYIIISRFDTGASGGASLWALDATQFEAFVAAGRSEDFLSDAANVTASATDGQGGSKGWNTTGVPAYLEIVTSNVTGRADEIRFGESLEDVTPLIPEPSHAMLSAFGLLGLLARRGRHS